MIQKVIIVLLFLAQIARASCIDHLSKSTPVADANECLFERVWAKDLAGAKLAIEYGADIHSATQHGTTALVAAVLAESTELVEFLLKSGVNPDTDGGPTPLFAATVAKSSAPMIKVLLDGGANPNLAAKNGMTPLMAIVNKGKMESVLVLLDAGADPKLKAEIGRGEFITALQLAARAGFHEIGKVLLERGALEDELPGALFHATTIGHNEFVKMLLFDFKADPNSPSVGSHSLLFRAFSGLERRVRFNSPLTDSYVSELMNLVGLLLEKGAVFRSSSEIFERMKFAEYFNYPNAILDENGKPTTVDEKSFSPLFLASLDKKAQLVDELLAQNETFKSSAELVTLILHNFQSPTLNFDNFAKFLYEHSRGRGEVRPYDLNQLVAGAEFSYDARMIVSIGLSTLKTHVDDEEVNTAIDVIKNGMSAPSSEAVKEGLQVLHKWLQKQTGA